MTTIGSGKRHRNLVKQDHALSMHLINSILKKELIEKMAEVKELKETLSLMDNSLTKLKDLDPQDTIKEIRKYKAQRFN